MQVVRNADPRIIQEVDILPFKVVFHDARFDGLEEHRSLIAFQISRTGKLSSPAVCEGESACGPYSPPSRRFKPDRTIWTAISFFPGYEPS